MKTPVIYRYGSSNLAKTEPALMEWTQDGKLRISTESSDGSPGNILADLSPDEITKVGGQMTSVSIHTAGTVHRIMIVSDSSINPNVGLPADQVVNQYQEYSRADVPAWIDSFRQKGVTITHLNQAQVLKYSLIATAVIIVCASIYAAIVT